MEKIAVIPVRSISKRLLKKNYLTNDNATTDVVFDFYLKISLLVNQYFG